MKTLKAMPKVVATPEAVHLSQEDVSAINASVADAQAGLGRSLAEAWQELVKPLEDEKKKHQGIAAG